MPTPEQETKEPIGHYTYIYSCSNCDMIFQNKIPKGTTLPRNDECTSCGCKTANPYKGSDRLVKAYEGILPAIKKRSLLDEFREERDMLGKPIARLAITGLKG